VVLGEDEDTAGWELSGELDLCDRAVGLFVGPDELWAVGERHITHVRVEEAGLRVVSTFELLLDSQQTGDVFARRLAPDSCGGSLAPGDVVSAGASGRVLAVGFEHRMVTFDLGKPSRLPTLGSLKLEKRLDEIGTDGGFVYAHAFGGASWQSWRIGPAVAFAPTGNEPAHGFALGRQYTERYSARLTGAALHVASW